MIRPKKHLGQHFLHDQHIAQTIVSSLPEKPGSVLEIGPGKGILTQYLLAKKDVCLKCIEIDGESVEYLTQNYPQLGEDLIQGDFLEMDLESIFPQPYWIIGNFPYNISTQILFRVFENTGEVQGLVGMFQREVAKRIVCGPGSKEYGILSVLLQTYYKIEYLFTVSEGSFFPPPKVKSGVIRLTRLHPMPDVCEMRHLRIIVKAAFNQRRKTLRNSLKSIGVPSELIPESLAQKRAEQLSVTDFQQVVSAVYKYIS